MSVHNYIQEKIKRGEKLLFAVIDPADYPSIDDAVNTAEKAYEAEFDAILVGGSTEVQGYLLDETVKRIKERISLPVILFPGNIGTITPHADAMYFMSLLNSRNPYWITKVQLLALPVLKRIGLELLSTAYVVVEPGGTVGWVGEVDLVPQDKPKLLAGFAMLAQEIGYKYFLSDVGSNAPSHVPLEAIAKVKKAAPNLTYIVAGGVKTPEQLKKIYEAGADIVQIGTVLEKGENPRNFSKVRDLWK